MKKLKTLEAVHTHTHPHTQYNLLNKKSMKNVLLIMQKTDQLII